MNEDSILDVTKKLCGIDPEDTSYDLDFITHINTVFFYLHQLGVGPVNGFTILDRSAKWIDFTGEENIAAVKTYMSNSVRLVFDPPGTGPATEALERLIAQAEWRLNIHMEGVKWDEQVQTYLQSTELT